MLNVGQFQLDAVPAGFCGIDGIKVNWLKVAEVEKAIHCTRTFCQNMNKKVHVHHSLTDQCRISEALRAFNAVMKRKMTDAWSAFVQAVNDEKSELCATHSHYCIQFVYRVIHLVR